MVKVGDTLRGVNNLALDTSPVIYFVEAHPRYGPVAREVFQRIAAGEIGGFTSVVTLSEVLVRPLALGDIVLQDDYRRLLLQSEHVDTRPISSATAERAAELRARYGMRLPDALQLAMALQEGCQAFLTNDLRLKRVAELPVLVLDEPEQ